MAIPFLNNINLSDNQLLNAKLQVTSTAPTAAVGQIYFDSTLGNETAKYYSNVTDTWVSLKEYSFPTGTYVTGAVTGTFPKPIITFDLNAVDAVVVPISERYLTKSNQWAEISLIPGTYNWTVSDGTNSTAVPSGETVTFSGTVDEIEVAESGRTVTIGLPNDVTIANNLTVGGTGNFTGQVTIPILPAAQTDAASKDYIDNAVVGGLVYQGGYNAATNTPDLTTSPNSILKGWTYTVTADGTFFGEQLRVGDVLIAEVNDPSALGDWTTVQNNIDLASLTQVGIGNVNASTLVEELGIAVDYAAGTAKVGLDIIGLPTYSGSASTPDTASLFIPLHNADNSDSNEIITIEGLAPIISGSLSKSCTITAGNLSGTVTHAFGINTLVQTINSSGDTVFCDVTRTATTSVATIAVAEATDITILVQKIG